MGLTIKSQQADQSHPVIIYHIPESADLFVSATPGFEDGPGIFRDGLTAPSMRDVRSDDPSLFTTDAFAQRAGTWTLYQHVKHFMEEHKNYNIVAIQNCGDLTLNSYHIAFLKNRLWHAADLEQNDLNPSRSLASDPKTCLVKWKQSGKGSHTRYSFERLRFIKSDGGWNPSLEGRHSQGEIELILGGKIILFKGTEPHFSIDQFDDVRHVFNLPQVQAVRLQKDGTSEAAEIYFGEFSLFRRLNGRRAALHMPILIAFRLPSKEPTQNQPITAVRWAHVKAELQKKGYIMRNPPRSPGEFRKYADDSAEVFFLRNVYPFGILGITSNKRLVSVVCSGLSGQVGTTIEGITAIMRSYLKCTDAIILDEGYDPFVLRNRRQGAGWKYTNTDLLKTVSVFSLSLHKAEQNRYRPRNDPFGSRIANWPRNQDLFRDLNGFVTNLSSNQRQAARTRIDKLFLCRPLRCQMRAVLIFAEKHGRSKV